MFLIFAENSYYDLVVATIKNTRKMWFYRLFCQNIRHRATSSDQFKKVNLYD